MECRLRDLTYAGTIEVDVEVFYEDENENFCRFIPKISIG
jgi:DNA-directed RNA polymerase beta subunit